jgi:formylmethanofuran dehydrogenase subunit E
MPEVKFGYSPEVLEELEKLGKAELQLVGLDGNAWSVIGAIRQAMRHAGFSSQAQSEMSEDATSGDYNHVLQTAMFWTDFPEDKDDYDPDVDDLVTCVECGVEDYPENMKKVNGRVHCEYCAEDLEY